MNNLRLLFERFGVTVFACAVHVGAVLHTSHALAVWTMHHVLCYCFEQLWLRFCIWNLSVNDLIKLLCGVGSIFRSYYENDVCMWETPVKSTRTESDVSNVRKYNSSICVVLVCEYAIW